MDSPKIKAAKNLAAVRALEAYARCLKEELGEPELADLGGTEHLHTAIMLSGETTVALLAHWTFSTNPEVVAKCLAMRKGQGVS